MQDWKIPFQNKILFTKNANNINSFIHSTVYQDNLKKDNTIPENPIFKQLKCFFLAEGAESIIK